MAELLTVQDQTSADAATRLRIGRLFLAASSPAHAADVFRGLLTDQPASVEAHTGLGDADFAKGDYRAAENDYQSALRLKPGDPAAVKGLDLASRVLALDPAVRGIGAAERFRRSRILLQMTLDADACLGPSPPSQDLRGHAEGTLKDRVSPAGEDAATETNLDLAAQLWQVRKSGCQPAPDPDDPLGLVLAKAAAR